MAQRSSSRPERHLSLGLLDLSLLRYPVFVLVPSSVLSRKMIPLFIVHGNPF